MLDRRLGIPITLAVVAMEVGRRCGVALDGISMPGHFLVRSTAEPDRYLDVFDGGRELDPAGCRAIFERVQEGMPWDDRHLEPAVPWAIVSRVLANLAGAYRRAGDYAIAMAVATLSMQAKDYVAAEAQLKRALEISPKDPDAVRLYLGQVNEELQRPDEALRWYSSITHGAQFIAAQARYAGVLAKQGKLAEARKYLQSVNAGDAQQRTQLTLAEANLLREASAYQEAFDFLSQAVAGAPDAPDLLYDHAMAAEKVNRIDVLESNLRKVIKMRPDYAHAYNALGYTLADRKERLAEARTLIEMAHKLAPADPFILDSLGWVLHRVGENQQALGHLQRAYEVRPDGEIAAHLGEVLWVLGRQAEAQKLWVDALRNHSKNEVLQSTVKRLAPVILQSAQ